MIIELIPRIVPNYSQFNMGQNVEDMQVGCLWQGDYILTVSLSGYINYLDRNNPDKPSRIIKVSDQEITPECLFKLSMLFNSSWI